MSTTMNRNLPRFVRDMLASPPPRGAGLNNWCYRTARVLHPYRSANEIILLLEAATAGEKLKGGEIARAVERSRATAWQPGQVQAVTAPAWPSVNEEQREAITGRDDGLVDLWEASPARLDDNDGHTEEIIDRLFPGSPLLCVGRSNSEFATRPREILRGRLAELQFIVPSTMSARTGRTQDGKVSEHTLENTGSRRFLVIEFDMGSQDEHAAFVATSGKSRPARIGSSQWRQEPARLVLLRRAI